jgi:hypothetical protein
MDPIYYIRVASAGWVFLAVVLASLWSSQAPAWQSLTILAKSGQASIAVALLAAVAGVGAPPALGMLLERITRLLLLVIRWDLWQYSFLEDFYEMYKRTLVEEPSSKTTPGGIFHVFLYSAGPDQFVDWLRRRIAHLVSSVTSALAILVGLLTAIICFHAFSWAALVVCIIIAAALLCYAVVEHRVVLAAGSSWVASLGYRVLQDHAANRQKGAKDT